MKQTQPLVSVIIATYNSSAFILEALESVKEQTYSPIELIVTDDGSRDQTVAICRSWMDAHQNRFHKAMVVTTPVNTGTCQNLNRALEQAGGEWLKFFAGDDKLYPTCLEQFVAATREHPGGEVFFCNQLVNGASTPVSSELRTFFNLEAPEQYRQLLKNSILPAACNFLKHTAVTQVRAFDVEYRLFDDYPFFVKLLKQGHRFYHVDQPLVYYRIHENNVSHRQEINPVYFNDIRLFFERVYLKELWRNSLYFHLLHYLYQYVILVLVSRRMIRTHRWYDRLLTWGGPLFWKNRLGKRLNLA
ncbi:MAG TPA: glycosyltransferase [Lacibacter sp.]|nr:glycosyltransferase [Lacibacter sp.]HMO90222.1 glycosyltransferase [Lacibacter sp.]HMP87657.1 glycosyltransferase [Lacibacter sp.]